MLVKRAVLAETTPGAGRDRRRAWEALQGNLASWFVEAYFAP